MSTAYHQDNPNLKKHSTSEQLSMVFVFTFGFLGLGISLLVLVVIHDTIVQYNSEIKWFILLIATAFVLIFLLYIGGHVHFSLKRKHLELEVFEQNNLLPRTIAKRNQLTIEQQKQVNNDEEFITFTDKKTHEIYCEMLETDTFSLNKLAIEIYNNTGGEYNKKLRASLAKFRINI